MVTILVGVSGGKLRRLKPILELQFVKCMFWWCWTTGWLALNIEFGLILCCRRSQGAIIFIWSFVLAWAIHTIKYTNYQYSNQNRIANFSLSVTYFLNPQLMEINFSQIHFCLSTKVKENWFFSKAVEPNFFQVDIKLAGIFKCI